MPHGTAVLVAAVSAGAPSTATLGFHAPGGILTNIAEPGVNKSVSINLEAETPGLSVGSSVNGTVQVSYTLPPGVALPTGNPTSVTLSGGLGWATVDVGTTPATAPSQ